MVTEYRRLRWTCSCGGVTTCAELPEGVPAHTSGPRRLAVTAVWRGLLRPSQVRTAELWQRDRAGRSRHATLRKLIQRHCWPQFENTLEDGQRCSHAPTVSRCDNLLADFNQLRLFTEIAGIEPTNNRVERALRRNTADDHRNRPPTRPTPPRLPLRNPREPHRRKTNPQTTPRRVNVYPPGVTASLQLIWTR